MKTSPRYIEKKGTITSPAKERGEVTGSPGIKSQKPQKTEGGTGNSRSQNPTNLTKEEGGGSAFPAQRDTKEEGPGKIPSPG
jgi:hypothetical protein